MQAKANDATVTFDEGWLTIKHTGLSSIARGGTRPNRIHVRGMAGVELTEPRTFAGWFTVVPADVGFSESPVERHRDPLTVRFSARALPDLQAIRFAIQDAMRAIREPLQEPSACLPEPRG
jgi:hypothetical protein